MHQKCSRSYPAPRPVRRVATAAVLLGAGVAAAGAQAPTAEALIERACAGTMSNVELKQCLMNFASKTDRELNAVWKSVLASIEASELKPAQRLDWRKKLTAAQRLWAEFRAADCTEAVGYEWFGGTGMSGAVSTCLAKHALDRIQHLKARYLDK